MSKKEGSDCYKRNTRKIQIRRYDNMAFPERGNWATHSGKYRGNWSPYIPRNIILRYSKEKRLDTRSILRQWHNVD